MFIGQKIDNFNIQSFRFLSDDASIVSVHIAPAYQDGIQIARHIVTPHSCQSGLLVNMFPAVFMVIGQARESRRNLPWQGSP